MLKQEEQMLDELDDHAVEQATNSLYRVWTFDYIMARRSKFISATLKVNTSDYNYTNTY